MASLSCSSGNSFGACWISSHATTKAAAATHSCFSRATTAMMLAVTRRARTKGEAVELGLRALVKLKQQEGLRAFRGKLRWDGDLEALRLDSAAPLPGVDPEEGEEP